jgi:hypothetical protein
MSISKLLTACSIALASLTLAAGAHADDTTPAKKVVKKAVVKTKKAAAKPVQPKAPDEEADEPAITDTTAVDCTA